MKMYFGSNTSKKLTVCILCLFIPASGAYLFNLHNQSKILAQKNNDLFLAINNDDEYRCDFLLKNGADPNASYTAEIANRNFLSNFIRYIMGKRDIIPVEYEHAEFEGFPTIVLATIKNKMRHSDGAIIFKLFEFGVDINARDDSGNTALIWASGTGQFEIVNFLLGHGAECNIQNKDGSTALMWAAGNGQTRIVKLLIEKGANRHIRDKENLNASDYAIKNNYNSTASAIGNH